MSTHGADNEKQAELDYESNGEENVWSRGSTFERISSEEIRPAVIGGYKDRRPNLYRHEGDGILVYDKKARVVGTGREPPARSPDFDRKRSASPSTHRELENAEEPDRSNFFRMKSYSPFPTFPIDYTLEVPPDSLSFESRFESGNLARVVRVQETAYDLYLSYDTETKGHTQWFYFSVSNSRAGTFTFNIVNLLKFDSLYNEGLLPAVRSERMGNEWQRGGFAVAYFENESRASEFRHRTYTLTFKFTFQHASDTVYFAHCVPYTFTDLNKYVDGIKTKHAAIARVNPMCMSLAGNVCELITITHNVETYRSFEEELQEWNMSAALRRLNKQRVQRQEKLAENVGKRTLNEHRRKQGIVFTARAHPGEAPGSYMLKGVIDFLLSDCRVAKLLRKYYVFKIVPMLNPDGVRYGNYRCSTLGVDLNRRWENPNKMLHPTVYHTKRMMQAFSEWHNVVMFCDFHGHSCKRGVFAYGCSKRSSELEDRKKSILARMIPILLAQKNPVFSFRDCHFRIEKSKEATARVVAFRELKIVNSYTVEASFFGPKSGACFSPPRHDCHMLPEDYEALGKDLCSVCLHFMSKGALTKKLWMVAEWIKDQANETKKESDHGVTRSRSLQDSLARKIVVTQEADFRDVTPDTVRAELPEIRPCFIPASVPEAEDLFTELESIEEEEEVLSGALKEETLWEDLLENEDALESSDGAGESDSAPSDHGYSPRPPTSKLKRKVKRPRYIAKVCRNDQSADKPEDSEEKTPVRVTPLVARANPAPRPPRPSKSPKSYPSSAIVQFSFLEDSARAISSESGVREGGLRRPGRLAELLRGPELREESPLQVMGFSDRARKFGVNNCSFLAPQRNGEQERTEERHGLTATRVATAQPRRRRGLKLSPEDPFRRGFRPRPPRVKEVVTIESVLQTKELRRRADCDTSSEYSLMSALPKVQVRDGDHLLLHKLGRGRKLSFKTCGRMERPL